MIYYGWGVVPEEYQKCMVGMKRNLKQTLEIRDTASDPRVKLQAAAIANDWQGKRRSKEK